MTPRIKPVKREIRVVNGVGNTTTIAAQVYNEVLAIHPLVGSSGQVYRSIKDFLNYAVSHLDQGVGTQAAMFSKQATAKQFVEHVLTYLPEQVASHSALEGAEREWLEAWRGFRKREQESK